MTKLYTGCAMIAGVLLSCPAHAQEEPSEPLTHKQVQQARMDKAAQEAIYTGLMKGINTPTSAMLGMRTLVEIGHKDKALANPELELREALSQRLGELGMPLFGESILLDQVAKSDLGYIAAAVYPEAMQGVDNKMQVLEKTFQHWKGPNSALNRPAALILGEKPKMKALVIENVVTPLAAESGIDKSFFSRYIEM